MTNCHGRIVPISQRHIVNRYVLKMFAHYYRWTHAQLYTVPHPTSKISYSKRCHISFQRNRYGELCANMNRNNLLSNVLNRQHICLRKKKKLTIFWNIKWWINYDFGVIRIWYGCRIICDCCDLKLTKKSFNWTSII